MPRSQGRSGRPWRTLTAQVYAEETHCWLCHTWVDQTLPHNDRWSRTVDHVVPLILGGDPLDRANCRLAHRRCNSIRGARLLAALRAALRHQQHVDRSYLALDPTTI